MDCIIEIKKYINKDLISLSFNTISLTTVSAMVLGVVFMTHGPPTWYITATLQYRKRQKKK